jgi:hypothetical protein
MFDLGSVAYFAPAIHNHGMEAGASTREDGGDGKAQRTIQKRSVRRITLIRPRTQMML